MAAYEIRLRGHIGPEWAHAHREFHHVLLDGGRSARLTAIADGLRDCSDLYLHWSRDTILDLEHAERQRFVREIGALNSRISGE